MDMPEPQTARSYVAPAPDTLSVGRVIQEMGDVSIVEVILHLKYGRTSLAGYRVLGGAGDPTVLYQTEVAAEAEFLRRVWHRLVRRTAQR